jgi:hypothetical protein
MQTDRLGYALPAFVIGQIDAKCFIEVISDLLMS